MVENQIQACCFSFWSSYFRIEQLFSTYTKQRRAKKKKRGRPIKVDWEELKKKNAIERFFSWIESCKKVFPRYEIKEISYLGVVILAAIMRLAEVLGQAHKKDTYKIKCTSKGRKISLEIIGNLFNNSSKLKSVLDNLEIEDFPQLRFPYENPSIWGFPERSVIISQSNRKEIEARFNFNKKDWWTDEPGYY